MATNPGAVAGEEAGRSPTTGDWEVFPRQFGNYLLLARLGSGGMGSVFLAQHGVVAGMEKVCVIKTVRPALTEDEMYVRRFADEARVVVQLGHRNICSVFDVGKVGHRYYLAMELVSGVDLGAIVKRLAERGGHLDTGLALHIVCEILDALDYSHRLIDTRTGDSLRIVHRDVSPHNVMISYEGEVKLIDFGLAVSALKGESTEPNVVLGKMAYMAPEQARGEPVDGRADLYSTAVVAYELLANERYYAGKTQSELSLLLGGGNWINPRLGLLPMRIGDALASALHPDPKQRLATCAELKDQLEAVLVASGFRGGARAARQLLAETMPDAIESWRATLLGATKAASAGPLPSAGLAPEIESQSYAKALKAKDAAEADANRAPATDASTTAPTKDTGRTASRPSLAAFDGAGRKQSGSADQSAQERSATTPTAMPTRVNRVIRPRRRAVVAGVVACTVVAGAVGAWVLASWYAARTTTSEGVPTAESTSSAAMPSTTTTKPATVANTPPAATTSSSNASAPDAAAPTAPTTPVANASSAATEPASAPPAAAPDKRAKAAKGSTGSSPAASTTKVLRLPQMLATLRTCDRPCAAPLITKGESVGQMEPAEINAFKSQVSACLATCKP